jgi:hypothetical protein
MCGPSGSRANLRILTGGSIAIMCSIFRCGIMTAGPDGVRDPAPNKVAAFTAVASDGVLWIFGSTDRHLIQLCHPGTNAWGRRVPASCRARHHGQPRPGRLVVQSRPKPRGGSIAWSSPGSSSTIVARLRPWCCLADYPASLPARQHAPPAGP